MAPDPHREAGASDAHEAAIALRADVGRARVRPCRIVIDGAPPEPISPESGVKITPASVREVTLRREEGALVAVATLDDDVRPITIAVDGTGGIERACAQLGRYRLGEDGDASVWVDPGAEPRQLDIPEAVGRVEVVRTGAHEYGLRAESDEGRAIACDSARSGAKIRYADPREALRAGEALTEQCDVERLRTGAQGAKSLRLDGRWPRHARKAPGLDDAHLLVVQSLPGGARVDAWPEHRGTTHTRETAHNDMLVMQSGHGAGARATLLYNPLAGDAEASTALCAALDASQEARASDVEVASALERVRARASSADAQGYGQASVTAQAARAQAARSGGTRPPEPARAARGLGD